MSSRTRLFLARTSFSPVSYDSSLSSTHMFSVGRSQSSDQTREDLLGALFSCKHARIHRQTLAYVPCVSVSC